MKKCMNKRAFGMLAARPSFKVAKLFGSSHETVQTNRNIDIRCIDALNVWLYAAGNGSFQTPPRFKSNDKNKLTAQPISAFVFAT